MQDNIPFRVSCSTGTLYHLPLKLAFSIIKQAGFDGVEIDASPELLIRGAAYAKKLAREFNLPIYTFHPPLYPFPGWPKAQTERILAVARFAQDLDCESFVIHAPKSYSLATPRAKQYLNGVHLGVAFAEQHQLKFGLETAQKPVKKKPRLFDSLDYFIDFTDKNKLSVVYDTGHSGASGEDFVRSAQYIGGRLCNVHFNDVFIESPQRKAKTHLAPGKGNCGDLAAFLRELARQHYTGPVTYELSPFEAGLGIPQIAIQKLRDARSFVQKAFDSGSNT